MLEFFQNLDLQYLLSTYGYYAILLLTFLEGETIVILAGIAASQGLLNPVAIAVCAFLGSCTSDQIMFSLGKYKGPAVLKRFPRLNRNLSRVTGLFKKYDVMLILGFRFVYGVRNITPIMLGISGVSHLKFLVLNLIGAAVWAASFTAGGFYLAHAFSNIVHNFGTTALYVLGIAILIGLFIWFIRYRINRAKVEELAAKGRAKFAKDSQDEDSPDVEELSEDEAALKELTEMNNSSSKTRNSSKS